jgi:4-hydroxy-tetrahydrodipicolinate reductase
MAIRILVNGALGRMGQEVIKMVETEKEFTLVGSADKNDNLADIIHNTKPQVVIDFTHPSSGFNNTKTIIECNVHPIIGTTGFTQEQIKELQKLAATKKLGGIIAPNFSIGAVLMMKYSQDAAKYFPNIEIIELHHDGKADSPSGTAIKTAEMIAGARTQKPQNKIIDKPTLPGARGAQHQDIHIHAVRLPGIVANQEVIFGGLGETLKICHTTINREAFMPGVHLACQKVQQLDHLAYGLEQIL